MEDNHMKILMSNKNINDATMALLINFNDQKDLVLPIPLNFAIQKNLMELARQNEIIEKMRNDIGNKYGQLQNDNSYFIPEDKREEVSKELQQLLSLEQPVDIRKVHLKDLDGLQLTSQQMQALLFMIEEE
jgi:hypothetical protein